MNNGVDEETLRLRVALVRQRQIVESKKKDMAFLEQKIRENLQHQDEVYLKLFPPVRPDRNAAYIASLIEEKNAELIRLQEAINAQETVSGTGDLRIPDADGSLSQLKRQYATIYANLEHLRSLLSPIRILPVELLAEIFMLAYDPMGTASLSNPGLVVTHVCTSWRQIAIHKPDLWSSLKLGPRNFTIRPHGVIPLARLWLERSGNRPLRLFVRPDERSIDSPVPTPTGLFLQLVRLYTPYFARWQDIFVDFPRLTVTEKLFLDIPEGTSCLESFGLIANNITYEDVLEISRLLCATRLKRLTWIIKSLSRDPSFRFGQLTQLEVGGDYSLGKASGILSLGKSLRVLDFTVFTKMRDSELAHVVNESLQQLTLVCAGNSSVFFDIFTLPALQGLCITKTYSWETDTASAWSQRSFVQFLRRSKCHLTSLVIVDYELTSDELLTILRLLSPTLTKFEIESFQARFLADDVLDALTYPLEDSSPDADDKATILCPLLRELRIVGCLASTDGVLARMVKSRCHPPPRLARLEMAVLGLDPTKSPKDYASIIALNGRRIEYMILDEAL